MTDVYLLYHVSHPGPDDDDRFRHVDETGFSLRCDEQAGDDVKLLGVYSSAARAQSRIASARTAAGFRDEPDCFEVVPYTVDHDEWAQGYAVVHHDE
jgi:hypothetical protein